jgi:3'(2'), 5'-bisphosphate nucleotidase
LTQTASAKICYRNAKSAETLSGCRKTETEKRIKPLKEHSALSGPSHTTGEAFDFSEAASVLTDSAAKAGAAIMRHYHEGPEVMLKDDQSPVTAADHDSQAILLEALKRLAPNTPVVSEEDAGDRSKTLPRRFFLVDPLDGTKEFIKKLTDFTVNVALIEDGVPCFGLVYAPARNVLALTAEPGRAVETELAPNVGGADFSRLACRPIQVRKPGASGLVAVVSRSHLDAETEKFLGRYNIASRSDAGSSLKFLLVARGEADVYPRLGPTMEWDTAAGDAVLRAAGGRVFDAGGGPFIYGKTDAGLRNSGFVAWGAAA